MSKCREPDDKRRLAEKRLFDNDGYTSRPSLVLTAMLIVVITSL